MEMLLPEHSGALSVAPVDGDAIEGGRAAEQEAFSTQEGHSEQPVEERRPPVPVEIATREESTKRGARVVVRRKGMPPAEATKTTDLRSAEFILSLPKSLSASEAVARAREQGLTISEPYVYKVRYDAMAMPEPASVAAPVDDAMALPERASVTTPVAEQVGDNSDAAHDRPEARPPEAASSVAPRSKSDFIRGLPTSTSPKEVVAMAKAQGMSISTSYVHEVRAAAKTRVTPKAPAAPTSVQPKSVKVSKADFVRSLPPDLPFAQAASKAKSAGILLSPAHFYAIKRQVRLEAEAAHEAKPRKPAKKPAPAQGEGLRLASDDPREQSLIDVVRVLGVVRARAVLDAIARFENVP